MASVYHVNKGVNRPIIFKGLKGQYIAWLAISLVLLFLCFAVLYLLGAPLFFVLPTIVGLAAMAVFLVFYLSNRFGIHGLLKYMARKRLPKVLKFRSRGLFNTLKYPRKLFEPKR